MYEGFGGDEKEKRGRFGASLVVSFVVYGAIAAAVVAGSTFAHAVIQEDALVQVEFARAAEAPPPEPPPPPPPPVAAAPRARAPRAPRHHALEAPSEIPDERPAESGGALTDEGALDGSEDGVPGGTGAPPAPRAAPPPPPPPPPPRPVVPVQVTEAMTPPIPLETNRAPDYPEHARRTGVQATVIAKIVVNEDGSVGTIEILRGHPELDDVVRETLARWRFHPARLEGRPVMAYRIIRVPFRLSNI